MLVPRWVLGAGYDIYAGYDMLGAGYDIYLSTFAGNDFLYRYSEQVSTVDILIEMTDWSDVQKDVLYEEFTVGEPDDDYKNGYKGFDGGVDDLSMINKTYA